MDEQRTSLDVLTDTPNAIEIRDVVMRGQK